MRKRNKSQRGADKDRYLITYADLMTLLLGLFVVLYASSVTDLEVFASYKEAFYEVFDANGGSPLEGGEGILDNKGNDLLDPLLPPRERSLADVEQDLRNTLSEYFDKDQLDLRMTEEGLVLELNEKLLFEKGDATITKEKSHLLDTLAGVVNTLENPVEIAGHTDNDPIQTNKFPSNWHLASYRAANVAAYLFARGFQPTNVKITSFGDQRPLVANTSSKNKSVNRRVEITISEAANDTPISYRDSL